MPVQSRCKSKMATACVIKVYYLCMKQVLLWNGARSKIRGIRGLVTGLHTNKEKLT